MEQRIILKGKGKVVNPEEQEKIMAEQDAAEEMEKEPTEGSIDYNPMSDLVETTEEEHVGAHAQDAKKQSNITTDPTPPISDNPGFDQSAIQDARIDSKIEGGVTNPKRSTGPQKFNGDSSSEGGIIGKREPLSDSTPGAYELSGFHVEMDTGAGMVSIQITQDFKDADTAKLAVNGDKYLMPVKGGGFKSCQIIRGAPILCYEERQIAEYIDGKWRR